MKVVFLEVMASFHTHACYDPDADSEVPSVEDLAGDIDESVNGYVATLGVGYGSMTEGMGWPI